jgi:putative component of membrane protein insertase Oxa1/YidC/SpoIIIJ protein YidD
MRVFITILFISLMLPAFSQTSAEFEKVRQMQQKAIDVPENSSNQETGLVSGLFRFYKSAISSQDYYSCTFTPSCSEHAIQAIKKQGFLPGLLNSFDRLTRCNGLNRHHYPYDHEKHLLIDPVHDAHYNPL